MFFIKKITVLFMFACGTNLSYSQTFDLNPTRKVQIGIFTSWYNYFDGNPMVQSNYSRSAPLFTWLSNSKGLELVYFLDKKNALRISYDDVNINYQQHVNGPKSGYSGYVFKRQMVLLKLEYIKYLFEFYKFYFYINSGFVYRFGLGETVLVDYGRFDILSSSHLVNDFGFTVGIDSKISILKNLNGIISINYNNYIYRVDKGENSPYEWDNGSSRQSFSFSIGLGYEFAIQNKN